MVNGLVVGIKIGTREDSGECGFVQIVEHRDSTAHDVWFEVSRCGQGVRMFPHIAIKTGLYHTFTSNQTPCAVTEVCCSPRQFKVQASLCSW